MANTGVTSVCGLCQKVSATWAGWAGAITKQPQGCRWKRVRPATCHTASCITCLDYKLRPLPEPSVYKLSRQNQAQHAGFVFSSRFRQRAAKGEGQENPLG